MSPTRWTPGRVGRPAPVVGVDPRIQARRDQVDPCSRPGAAADALVVAAAVVALVAAGVARDPQPAARRSHQVRSRARPTSERRGRSATAGIRPASTWSTSTPAPSARGCWHLPWVADAHGGRGLAGHGSHPVTERTPVAGRGRRRRAWVLADPHGRVLAVVAAVPTWRAWPSPAWPAVTPGAPFGARPRRRRSPVLADADARPAHAGSPASRWPRRLDRRCTLRPRGSGRAVPARASCARSSPASPPCSPTWTTAGCQQVDVCIPDSHHRRPDAGRDDRTALRARPHPAGVDPGATRTVICRPQSEVDITLNLRSRVRSGRSCRTVVASGRSVVHG